MTTSALLILCALTGPYLEQEFQAAAAAHREGDYETAVERYEQLIETGGAAPRVFYNLGNAYYRLGRLGPAVANYERALRLDPSLDQARENLEFSVKQTKRGLPAPPPPAWERNLLFWHHGLAPGTPRRLALAAWTLVWLLLGLRLWRPWPYLRRGAVAAGLLAALLSLSAWAKTHPVSMAVTSVDSAPVYYSPEAGAPVHFELLEGDRVEVERRTAGWTQVKTAEGDRGWAQAGLFTYVGPPYEPPPEPGS